MKLPIRFSIRKTENGFICEEYAYEGTGPLGGLPASKQYVFETLESLLDAIGEWNSYIEKIKNTPEGETT